MTKRLSILLPDEELAALRKLAGARGQTLSAWVREAVRSAIGAESRAEPSAKLRAVRMAAAHSYPTGEIESMLADIELAALPRVSPIA